MGTKLITSSDCPALGGVYKLAAEIVDGSTVNKIKLTENPAKVTNPGIKKLLRVYDKDGMALADLIALEDEVFEEGKPLYLFDPNNTWKEMTVSEYTLREMQVPIFKDGKCVYNKPTLKEICAYARQEKATFWEQYRRLMNPHRYKVDLTERLWMLKQSMMKNR